MPTIEDVQDALSNVIDPELGLDFVELGLIYGVEIDDGHVRVTFTLTTPGCPIGPQVTEQIEEFVGELEGVKTIESEMVFTPPWCPETMIADGTAIANSASGADGDLGRNALKAGARKRRSAFVTKPTAKRAAIKGASAGTPVVRRTASLQNLYERYRPADNILGRLI